MPHEAPEIAALRRRLAALRGRAGANGATADLLGEIEGLVDDLSLADATAWTGPLERGDREVALPSAREEEWVELLTEAYLCTDLRGIVRKANDRAAQLFRTPKYFLVGRPLVMFVESDQRAMLRAELDRLPTTTRLDDLEIGLRGWGGEHVPIIARAATTYDAVGRPVEIRWLLRSPERESASPPADEPMLAGEPPGRRLAFLASVGGLLARSLDFERTLTMLANASLPLLGDWCLVDAIDEDGQIHRITVARVAGAEADAVPVLAGAAPKLDTPDSAIARAFRTGRAELLRDPAGSLSLVLAVNEAQRRALERIAPRSILGVPLVARGTVLGVLTFVMAHSRRRHTVADVHLATELAARASVLADHARLYRAAQQASQAKSDFLAAMSHELRTPLTAVVGYTELLADEIVGPLSGAQKEHLARIRASSNHLLVLIDEILTFARLEAGRDEVHPTAVSLHDLIDQAVNLVAPQAALRGLAVRVDLPPAPLVLRTDAGRLRQILVNLLANAAKFTSRGEVGVRAACDGNIVAVEVWDTGIGIAREHLDAIFSPFWQVEQHTTRQYGGTGLGLSVVRRLAQLLGGSVEVESEVGAGSRFTVRIPRELPMPPAVSATPPAPPRGQAPRP